jgi:hypothetical protein
MQQPSERNVIAADHLQSYAPQQNETDRYTMEADSLIVDNFPPFIRTYKDGRVERLLTSSFVPATEDPAAGRGVATRDVIINRGTGVSARLFLPLRAAAAAAGRTLAELCENKTGPWPAQSWSRNTNTYA